MNKFTKAIKKFRGCFLFAKEADGRRTAFWIWNGAFVVLSGAGTGIFSLLLAYGNYPNEIFEGYFAHPDLIALNLLPPILLTVFLYFVIGRAWIAHLIGGALILGSSAADYFKLAFRDDPLMASDIKDMGIGVKFGVESYKLYLNTRLALCAVFLTASVIFLAFFVRGRLRKRPAVIVRIAGAVLIPALIFPLHALYTDDSIYNGIDNFDFPKANSWSSTQRYITRGFVYPFLHSIPDAFPQKPDGYSDAEAKAILDSYEDGDIPADRKVNVIGIQLEAFNDFERMGIDGISESVYEKYRELEAESYTGRLVTNIFAGGTVDTERTFLTGYWKLGDFRHDVGSYVRYFKDQGYFTEGSHSCYDWFYNRKNVNAYIGFDRYWFLENRYGDMANGKVAYDDILIPDIVKLYKERDKTSPYFNFTVTYQGHGPYSTDSYTIWGDGYWSREGASHDAYFIMNNYLAQVKNTCENVARMLDELRGDPDPVVVVIFGDHNPWLGNSNSVYDELGVNIDTSTEEGFYNYYSTRYVIWANDAAKEALGFDFTGEGPDLSPCYLMNLLFKLCGWGKGPAYMQLANEVFALTPVLNTGGFYVENGRVTDAPSEKLAAELQKLNIAQYYRKNHPER